MAVAFGPRRFMIRAVPPSDMHITAREMGRNASPVWSVP